MATVERGPLPADNFTMLSNQWIRDDDLSFKARGVLSWLSSHAVGFRVSLERIAARSKRDGVTAVRSAINELEEAGYLVRRKERDEGGRITASVYVLQDPNAQVTPMMRKPDDGVEDANAQVTANMRFSHDGETPSLGNPARGKTSPLKKNISSKKNNEQQKTPLPPGTQLSLVAGQSGTVDTSTARTQRRKPVTFMSADWLPPADAADKLAADLGLTRQQLGDWLPEFRDYWIGKGEGRADWVAVWRNRMRQRIELGHAAGRGTVSAGRSIDPAADVLRMDREQRHAAAQSQSPGAFGGDVVSGEVLN